MPPGLHRALRFALAFLPLFLILAWVYSRVLPLYEPIPTRLADWILRAGSPAAGIALDETGGLQSRVLTVRGWSEFFHWQPFVKHLVYLNLALLPALLLATPVGLRRRLGMLGIGVLALVPVHAASLVVLVRGYLCLAARPESFLCLALLRGAYASGQLSAAILWAALTWRYWLTASKRPAPAEPASASRPEPATKEARNTPCLCGSGRKHKSCCGR